MAIEYLSDHLHLRSPDPERTARFYVEALKAREVSRVELRSGLRVVVDLGGLTLFIEQVPAGTARPPEPPFQGLEHIGLVVNDLDAAMTDLRERGVRFVIEPQQPRPGVRIVFIEGPERVSIELIERRAA